jgi:hypothetical protein
LTTDILGPGIAVDRFVKAVTRLYQYIPAAQRPSDGALHHIQYEQPVFDIQITDELFACRRCSAARTALAAALHANQR